uniref:Glycosyl hydrolases family 38 C-terminal domain-containing protein n=1 Tax=Timema douglasi TaxID=61478 RepID=A0A7R8ZC16_TIMDO|nr:unnamed protein product [Timema douglasi]
MLERDQLHRRLLHDDAFGVEEALNETAFGKGLVARGKHYVIGGPIPPVGSSPSLAALERDLAQRKLLSPWTFLSPANDFTFKQWASTYKMEYSGLTNALPPNVHILTLEPWQGRSLLLRLEHTLENTDDPLLSKPATVYLQKLFSPFTIVSARETTLGANQWLKDSDRLVWQVESNEVFETISEKPKYQDNGLLNSPRLRELCRETAGGSPIRTIQGKGVASQVVMDTPQGMNQCTDEKVAGGGLSNAAGGRRRSAVNVASSSSVRHTGLSGNIKLYAGGDDCSAHSPSEIARVDQQEAKAVLETRLEAVQVSVQEMRISINETRETFGNRLDEVRSAVNGRLEMFQQQNLAFQEQVETRLEVAEERILELVAPAEARFNQFAAQLGLLKEEAKRILTEAEARRDAALVEAARKEAVRLSEATGTRLDASPPQAVWGLLERVVSCRWSSVEEEVDSWSAFKPSFQQEHWSLEKQGLTRATLHAMEYREGGNKSMEAHFLILLDRSRHLDVPVTDSEMVNMALGKFPLQVQEVLRAVRYRGGADFQREFRRLDHTKQHRSMAKMPSGENTPQGQRTQQQIQLPRQLKRQRPDVLGPPPQIWGNRGFS